MFELINFMEIKVWLCNWMNKENTCILLSLFYREGPMHAKGLESGSINCGPDMGITHCHSTNCSVCPQMVKMLTSHLKLRSIKCWQICTCLS